MKHLGDITKLDGAKLPPVDIITGGSPCQDLSVAGKREGLAGERSGLFMEQVRIVKEMREATNGEYPKQMLWENVCGAFSSNGGEDFRAVIEEIARVADKDAVIPGPPKGKWAHAGYVVGDGWSLAWRVHDAQFWGVPQRRKRIALVADFRSERAAEILFERKGVSRDIEESGKAREGTAEDAERCVGKTGECLNPWDVQSKHIQPEDGIAESLYAGECRYGGGESYVMCLNDQGGQQMDVSENVSRTLRAQEHGHQPIVFEPGAASRVGSHVYEDGVAGTVRANAGDNQQAVVYGISSYNSNAMKSSNPNSGIYEAETARALDLNGGSPACNQGGMAVVYVAPHVTPKIDEKEVAFTLNQRDYKDPQVIAFAQNQRDEVRDLGDKSASLAAEPGVHQQTYVLEGNGARPSHKGDGYAESDTMYTLNATEHHAVCYSGVCAGFSGGQSDKAGSIGYAEDVCPTLRGGEGGNQKPCVVYDARGNGDGHTAPTITGDHENRVTDYTALCVGNGQANQSIGNVVNTISSRDYKGGQCVMTYSDCVYIVRRLTPLECERLQGFPVVRKVRFTEMTKDEYIAWNINEGHIVVDTEQGKVFATRGPGGVKLDEPRELTGSIVNGYRVVSIRNGETKIQCRVHRIVWIAAQGIIPDGYVIDHINNDKQDNRLCNLQLLTAAENSTKARVDGLYKIHGEAGQAKITDEVHDFIQYVYENTDLSLRQLSEIFGISKSRVQQIVHDEPWTDIGDWVDSKGKKHKVSDSPRYKALGNSIALPFWEWLAGRMVKSLGVENPTMGSLFDGIGGFPLVFSRNGCKPVWASEVDEFCIAVTKKDLKIIKKSIDKSTPKS